MTAFRPTFTSPQKTEFSGVPRSQIDYEQLGRDIHAAVTGKPKCIALLRSAMTASLIASEAGSAALITIDSDQMAALLAEHPADGAAEAIDRLTSMIATGTETVIAYVRAGALPEDQRKKLKLQPTDDVLISTMQVPRTWSSTMIESFLATYTPALEDAFGSLAAPPLIEPVPDESIPLRHGKVN